MATENKIILFSGYNYFYEYDGDNGDDPWKLKPYSNKSFTKLFCSNAFTIFADDSYENLYSAGYNRYGQCCVGHEEFSIKKITPITFFKENKITIKSILVSNGGNAVFFLTKDNKVYACGSVPGLEPNTLNIPQLMPLSDVIHATATKSCCIALCWSNDNILCMIIQNWSRLHSVPNDVISIIIMLCKSTSVYSTTNKPGSGHKKDVVLKQVNSWNEVEFFGDKHIIKIATGDDHVLFLDATGDIWSCGAAKYGQLGVGDTTGFAENDWEEPIVFTPMIIKYFRENDIKIVDVAVGAHHNIALDDNGLIYCWGDNGSGQCGDGTREDIQEPKLIQMDGMKMDLIRAGYTHGYCRSVCGKHFVWGDNSYGQCMMHDDVSRRVMVPTRIDNVIEKDNGMKIIEILPGYYNTKVIAR